MPAATPNRCKEEYSPSVPNQSTPSKREQPRADAPRPPEQLLLPIEHAPPKVRQHGYADAHERPLVGKTRRGRIVASFRTSPERAWRYRYLELNPANAASVLVFDCDDATRLLQVYPPYIGPSLLPEPNWTNWNARNGRAHVVYCLWRAVHCNRRSRRGPQILLAAVAERYAEVLRADDGYAGILSRNPMARPHRGLARTTWGRRKGYTLRELADAAGIGRPARLPQVGQARTAEGRNCITFELSMRWAGRPKNATKPVLPAAVGINAQFTAPMGFPEVSGIAKSVEKYRAQWVEEGRYYAHDSEAQRARQARGAASRRKRNAARDAAIIEARQSTGATHRQLGEAFGLHYRTVGRIIKRAGL